MANVPVPDQTAPTTSYRTCPLCEATCGIEVTLRGREVLEVRGDRNDAFSGGYICPKGVALKELHHDADRLKAPMVRRNDTWHEVTWDEAFDEIERRLPPLLQQHGRDAVAVYLGNPNVHNLSGALYAPVLIRALGTVYRFTASTLDQWPKQLASGLMFGTALSVAVPDVDRTDHLLILGGNPLASNGSLWTAPDLPARLRALRRRGGRLVVVDPRRTRTAEIADEHVPIRPGTDALLLAAIANTLLTEGLADLGAAEVHVNGLDEVRRGLEPFTAEAVAAATGIDPDTTRRLARELAQAPTAAVYGRMGTTTTRFGTVASWLVDVVNTLTGNLDRPGGVMWPKPAHGSPNTQGEPGRGRGTRAHGEKRTRVRGLHSVLGEFPTAALAEEIEGDGTDRVRALVTVAGNPVLSSPNGERLKRALSTLDLYVAVDPYLNETTRFADVILPVPSTLSRSQYEAAFTSFSVRNVAKWSAPALPLEAGERSETDILLRLIAIAMGGGIDEDAVDDFVAADVAGRLTQDPSSRAHGRDAQELLAAVAHHRREDRILDLLLRAGPYGDGFGTHPDGLSLDLLAAHPHGVDLGPLQPRLPEVLRTPSGMVELAPEPILEDLPRLAGAMQTAAARDELVLIGRRQLRSNNSWMHNVPLLAGGSNRCTLLVHPDDAAARGLAEGATATVASRVGEVEVEVEVSDEVMRGVVCLPHGWGHDVDGALRLAAKQPGVNSNALTDEAELDPLSGTVVLNGIPVTVSVSSPVAAAATAGP
jgi:anaerobic selenocysteine-containing dehydrogenase